MRQASRSLVGRGSVYTLASAGPMLTGLLVTPLLTRSVPVAEYGWISIGIVVMQWSISLLALGLPVAITRHALVETTGSGGARGIALVASSAVLGVAAVAALGVVSARGAVGADAPAALALALVAGGAGAGIAMTQAWALAEERSWLYVALAVVLSLGGPGVGVVAVTVLDLRGTTAYFAGVLSVNLVLLGCAMAVLVRTGPVRADLRGLGRALRVGLPIVPHQFATGSLNGVAVLVAGAVIGQAAGGQAQVAVYLGTVSLVLISAVGYAWMPVLAKSAPEERGRQLTETASTVTWLASLAAAGVAVLAPWLLRFLVPTTFDIAAMVPVTAVACLSTVAAAVYLAHQQVIVLSGRTAPLAWVSPLCMGLGVLVSWSAAHTLGLVGVAAGLPVTYFLLWFSTRVLARRADPLRWQERRVVLPVLTASAVCAAGALLPTTGPGAGVRLGLAVALAAAGIALLRSILTGSPAAAESSGVPR